MTDAVAVSAEAEPLATAIVGVSLQGSKLGPRAKLGPPLAGSRLNLLASIVEEPLATDFDLQLFLEK